MSEHTRGRLYPEEQPPTFRRITPHECVKDLVRWWWVSAWEVSLGSTSQQHILAYPDSKLSIEPDAIKITCPTTQAYAHELAGTSWVVGARLQPAGIALFTEDPASLADRFLPLHDPHLHESTKNAVDAQGLEAGVGVVEKRLRDSPPPSELALLANAMVALIEVSDKITKIEEIAEALNVSVGTVHRLAERYIGVTPYKIIQRRRLHTAAEQLRHSPKSLAEIALANGFSDQAHFAKEFKKVVGLPPSQYRESATHGYPRGK
ncbi:helix-turn-helix transcriptional regulator [Corynebacterium lubricantis]|uniref:helix-turn-helix transcriptional regulator n=1 Tax=Corynebacterium lubricantis TaxID=541095 RepID=UPI00036A92B4|nr:helix-turn-helix transcriptional regulator [Corynebacterium lubricantis]